MAVWLTDRPASYTAAPGFFVGNRNQGPPSKPWRWFQELNEQYGDVVFLQMGQTPTIVLGSAQVSPLRLDASLDRQLTQADSAS